MSRRCERRARSPLGLSTDLAGLDCTGTFGGFSLTRFRSRVGQRVIQHLDEGRAVEGVGVAFIPLDDLLHLPAVQAAEVADSAVRVALLEITAPPTLTAAQPLSNLLTVRVFDESVDVRIEREAQRVELNAADEAGLMSALLRQGMADSDARPLAARVVDWRDIDDQTGIQCDLARNHALSLPLPKFQ
jgi:hypothetical protein